MGPDKTTGVTCHVDSCAYWGDGHVCKADRIEVNNNVGGSSGSYTMEVGEMGGRSRRGGASTSTETQCQTYRPKSGGDIGHGGSQSRSNRR